MWDLRTDFLNVRDVVRGEFDGAELRVLFRPDPAVWPSTGGRHTRNDRREDQARAAGEGGSVD